jgi:hypothetical protein
MGFLDNLSYESKERTGYWRSVGHIAVYSNYARDLMKIKKVNHILFLIPLS